MEGKAPSDQARRNNERERGRVPPYQQLAADIARPLADLRVLGNTGNDDERIERDASINVDSTTENTMDIRQEPREEAQERKQRQGKATTYQQLAEDIAQPLAELQVSGASNERTTQHEAGQEPNEQGQERNQLQQTFPPNQQLAERRVPGDNNANREAATTVDGRNESEIESRHRSTERKEEVRGSKHYAGIATDISGQLRVLRVPGISDERDLRREVRTQAQRQVTESIPQQQSLSEYDPDATCGSGYEYESCRRLSEYSAGEIQSESDQGLQLASIGEGESTKSFPQQESLSEYNPDATCGSGYEYESCGRLSEYSAGEMQSERDQGLQWASIGEGESTKSFPQQESLSEYNPDATCGSGFESCEHSSTRSEEGMRIESGYKEGWPLSNQGEATKSAPQQESISEYNPDATCGSGIEYESCRYSSGQPSEAGESFADQKSFSEYNENATYDTGSYRGEFDTFAEYSNVQPETGSFESSNQESGGFSSKLPVERETDLDAFTKEEKNKQLDSCYSPPDGEPTSKRSKPNPEVSDQQLSLSCHERCDTQTVSIDGVEFPRSHGSISGMSSVESEHFEPFAGAESRESALQDNVVHARTRNDESLSSEFEHMNLEDNNSVERSTVSDYSTGSQSNQGRDLREKTHTLPKDLEDGRERSNDVGSDENASMARRYPQGARPKTNVKLPKRNKPKIPKPNTKNAYAELAKDVAGDLSAMNVQLGDTKPKDRSVTDEQNGLRHEDMVDGSAVQAQHQQQDTQQQQPSLTNSERITRDVRSEMEDTSMTDGTQSEDSKTRATSQQTHTASRRTRETREAAERRRQELEEQQRLVDNMGPELQALVIQMMLRDEEELGGGHVLHGTNLNPPVPPRLQYQRRGEGRNQGGSVQGASQQPGGSKSKKGKKKSKRHYVDIAGIIAPELAAVNEALMNGHSEKPEQSTELGEREEDSNAANQLAGGRSLSQERAPHRGGARNVGVNSRDQPLGNGRSSRDESRNQTSLPPSAANQRQRRGNGNRQRGK